MFPVPPVWQGMSLSASKPPLEKLLAFACWHCLPPNVLEEQHAFVHALQPVPD